MKVVIWGYPLHSHTHSYIHNAFYKAFQNLGYDTYWFDDNNCPPDFDFSNCLFLTEGFADKKIPLNTTSIYMVHVCVNPSKYLDANVKKLIDLRYLMNYMDKDNYEFVLNRDNCEVLQKGVLYDKVDSAIKGYDIVYLAWGTNLLPEEIDLSWARQKREETYYFIGSMSYDGRFANGGMVNRFMQLCSTIGVKSQHINPWINPVSEEQNRELTTKSFLSPDLRNEQHKAWGYIACRTIKSISYGQIGLTNSKINADFIDDSVLYSENIEELFQLGLKHRLDYDRIEHQMNIVKNEHTILHRAQGLIKLI